MLDTALGAVGSDAVSVLLLLGVSILGVVVAILYRDNQRLHQELVTEYDRRAEVSAQVAHGLQRIAEALVRLETSCHALEARAQDLQVMVARSLGRGNG